MIQSRGLQVVGPDRCEATEAPHVRGSDRRAGVDSGRSKPATTGHFKTSHSDRLVHHIVA